MPPVVLAAPRGAQETWGSTVSGLNLFWTPQVRLQGVRRHPAWLRRDVHVGGFHTGVIFSEHTDASSR